MTLRIACVTTACSPYQDCEQHQGTRPDMACWPALLSDLHMMFAKECNIGWFNLLGLAAMTTGTGFGVASPSRRSRVSPRMICMPSPSLAYANFFSSAATIGTNYKPNAQKTIEILAEDLFRPG